MGIVMKIGFGRIAALALAAISIAASPVPVDTTPALQSEPGLIGTWRLVRFENRAKDGTVTRPFGEHPLGYFVYDPTGHLSIHIMRTPPLPPFSSGDEEKATDPEKLLAYAAYLGYFGTYRVDKIHHILHHIVEGALNPIYTNTDQLRPYRLDGDVLIIAIGDPKIGKYAYRELHRVR
jgi:hypothetical protein